MCRQINTFATNTKKEGLTPIATVLDTPPWVSGSDCDAFYERMRCGYGLAVLTKTLDVKFNRFTNELHRLASRFPDRDATREIWNVRSDRRIALFNDDHVFHTVHSVLL
jgi:hypothetical protein